MKRVFVISFDSEEGFFYPSKDWFSEAISNELLKERGTFKSVMKIMKCIKIEEKK